MQLIRSEEKGENQKERKREQGKGEKIIKKREEK